MQSTPGCLVKSLILLEEKGGVINWQFEDVLWKQNSAVGQSHERGRRDVVMVRYVGNMGKGLSLLGELVGSVVAFVGEVQRVVEGSCKLTR